MHTLKLYPKVKWLKRGGGVTSKIRKAFEGYKVQSGDTVSKIAKKFNTTVDAIIKANPSLQGTDDKGNPKANFIQVGDILSVPTSEIVQLNPRSTFAEAVTYTYKTDHGTIRKDLYPHGGTFEKTNPTIMYLDYIQQVPAANEERSDKNPRRGYIIVPRTSSKNSSSSNSSSSSDSSKKELVYLGTNYYNTQNQSLIQPLNYDWDTDSFQVKAWNTDTHKWEEQNIDRKKLLLNYTTTHPSRQSINGEKVIAVNPDKGYYRTVNKYGNIVNHNIDDLSPEKLDKPEYSDEYESLVKAYLEKHKKNTE